MITTINIYPEVSSRQIYQRNRSKEHPVVPWYIRDSPQFVRRRSKACPLNSIAQRYQLRTGVWTSERREPNGGIRALVRLLQCSSGVTTCTSHLCSNEGDRRTRAGNIVDKAENGTAIARCNNCIISPWFPNTSLVNLSCGSGWLVPLSVFRFFFLLRGCKERSTYLASPSLRRNRKQENSLLDGWLSYCAKIIKYKITLSAL